MGGDQGRIEGGFVGIEVFRKKAFGPKCLMESIETSQGGRVQKEGEGGL